MTGSMIIYGTIGIFRKFIPLPSDALAFSRGIAGGVFLLLLMRVRGQRFAWEKTGKKNFILLAVTGAIIGFNWILLFEAYNYTTVAVATLCYYMQPVIGLMLSPLVLKERISGKQMFFAALSVAGMILVSGVIGDNAGGPGNTRGILLGLGAAVLYAAVILINKQIRGVPAYEKTVIQLISAAAALIPYMAAHGNLRSFPMNGTETVLLLIVCLVHTGIAYALYFGAIENLPARSCALLSYIDPVTAVLLSALFLHEAVTVFSAAGAVLIIGSAIGSELAGKKGDIAGYEKNEV